MRKPGSIECAAASCIGATEQCQDPDNEVFHYSVIAHSLAYVRRRYRHSLNGLQDSFKGKAIRYANSILSHQVSGSDSGQPGKAVRIRHGDIERLPADHCTSEALCPNWRCTHQTVAKDDVAVTSDFSKGTFGWVAAATAVMLLREESSRSSVR